MFDYGSWEQSEAYVTEVCSEALDGLDYVVSDVNGDVIYQGEE